MLFDPPTPELIAAAAWVHVEVRYPFATRQAVGPVTLRSRRGDRMLLLGPSGSGKSTLLLTLTGLVPRSIPAQLRGVVSINGTDVRSRAPAGWATEVAYAFQDADQTLCGMRVEDEIAFALENRALPAQDIADAITEAMREFGLPDAWRRRRVSTLSGGERQLVALAATHAQGTALFVADEPTAHLSPEAARRLRNFLTKRDADQSLVIVDHRLDDLIELIDRVVVLGEEGSIIADGHPRHIFRDKRVQFGSLGIWCPMATELDVSLAEAGVAAPIGPLSVGEAVAHLDPATTNKRDLARAIDAVKAFLNSRSAPAVDTITSAPTIVRLWRADCAPLFGPVILRGINLQIRAGEIVGILGGNGAGKSTLGLCLAGLLALKGGTRTGAAGGVAFQRAESQFVTGSVADELRDALPKLTGPRERDRLVARSLRSWGLIGLERQHPFELSEGQKRRLALATLTITDRWPLLVLDEPMAGLDAAGAAALTHEIAKLGDAGRAVALITHDMDLALHLCARCVVMGEGRVLADGPTAELMDDPALLRRAGLAEPLSAPAKRWLQRATAC